MFRRSLFRLAPSVMKAVVAKGSGDSSVLSIEEVPLPTLQREHDIRIQVAAAGVNRSDISQRRGAHLAPPNASPYLGLEVSGTVESVGPAVTRFKPGDKVMALLNGGGYAEYCVCSEFTTLPVPHGYSFVEAAAIPESFLTAWMLLKYEGKLHPGQRVLLHAGCSSLGMAASQIAETILKATAITTSSPDRMSVCRRFASINVSRLPDEFGNSFSNEIRAALGPEALVDVIIDPIFGGTYVEENASLIAEHGKLLVVAYVGGARLTFNALPFYRQRATIKFCQLRGKSDEYKKEIVESFEESVMPHLNERMIIPTVYRSSPIEEVAKVHDTLDAHTETKLNDTAGVGKFVLTIGNTAPHFYS